MKRTPSARVRGYAHAFLLFPLVTSLGCAIEMPSGPVIVTGGSSTSRPSTSSGALPSTSSDATSKSGTGSETPKFAVVIRADSNRDGRVDLVGQSDEVSKREVSRDQGALFLANVDDDAGRCKAVEGIEQCNDAADEVVNGSEDAKDLGRVKTLPLNVSDAGTAKISVTTKNEGAVRLFIEDSPGKFIPLTQGQTFSAQQIRKGIDLAIEAKTPMVNEEQWDGRVTVRFEVVDQGQRGSDEVMLKVAPLLAHSHLDPIERLIAAPLQSDPNTVKFRSELEKAIQDSGMAPAPLYLNVPGDEWAQDWMESFYASIPGPNGPVSMHVLVASDQERNVAYKQMYTLLGPNVGVLRLNQSTGQFIPGRDETYTSFGNIETIPPYANYSAGRLVLGGSKDKKSGPSARTMALLNAQGIQDPLWLHSSWLMVGHIDEFVTFLPAKNSKWGFKIAVIDPLAAVEILKKAKAEGQGNTLLHSYKPASDKEKAATKDSEVDFSMTIERFLAAPANLETQSKASRYIAENLKILQESTGVPDSDVVRLPGLFRETESVDFPAINGGGSGKESPGLALELQAIQEAHPTTARRYSRLLAALPQAKRLAFLKSMTQPKSRSLATREDGVTMVFIASVPGAINMVVSPNGHVITPKQFGPIVGGKDLFEAAIESKLASEGITANFVDEYVTYHLKGGEVHCATNTIRKPRTRWWK